MRPLLFPLVVAFATGLLASFCVGAPKVEQLEVGPKPGNPPNYIISRNGLTLASLVMKGTRSVVVVNGTEGPVFDEFIPMGGSSFNSPDSVLFSPDGKSQAYAVRVGDNYSVVRDGKELFRGPLANRPFQGTTGQLRMSPGGKHVYFMDMVSPAPSQNAWRLVVNGKPGPLSSNNNSFSISFSPDDSRWVYTAAKFGGARDERLMVVDGKEVTNPGQITRFTADNKLVTVSPDPQGTWTLNIEGKTAVKGVAQPEKIWFSSVGSRFAAAVRKAPEKIALVIDGKEVAAADGARNVTEVVFSPDGRRYLAVCQTAAANFVITDGKKGPEYRTVTWPTFTHDSSRALYVVGSGSKSFVITEGQESAGFEGIGGQYVKLALPKTGKRFAYTTYNGMNTEHTLVVDATPIPMNKRAPMGDSLVFSENGTRYALVATATGRSDISALIIDGEEVPGMLPHRMMWGTSDQLNHMGYFVLSPDGQHVANVGTRGAERGLFVNGKLVSSTGSTFFRPAFTPDSKHLIWVALIPDKTVRDYGVFVDGRLAVELPSPPNDGIGSRWEMTADGVYQFLTVAGNVIKRYRVTAPDDTSIATLLAEAENAKAKLAADAVAAKKKADADALAAKENADADAAAAAAKRKADTDAAVAKRKADADAKTKARLDALEARKKAATDAAAAKAAKR